MFKYNVKSNNNKLCNNWQNISQDNKKLLTNICEQILGDGSKKVFKIQKHSYIQNVFYAFLSKYPQLKFPLLISSKNQKVKLVPPNHSTKQVTHAEMKHNEIKLERAKASHKHRLKKKKEIPGIAIL